LVRFEHRPETAQRADAARINSRPCTSFPLTLVLTLTLTLAPTVALTLELALTLALE